jgi:hypothetical protein
MDRKGNCFHTQPPKEARYLVMRVKESQITVASHRLSLKPHLGHEKHSEQAGVSTFRLEYSGLGRSSALA